METNYITLLDLTAPVYAINLMPERTDHINNATALNKNKKVWQSRETIHNVCITYIYNQSYLPFTEDGLASAMFQYLCRKHETANSSNAELLLSENIQLILN